MRLNLKFYLVLEKCQISRRVMDNKDENAINLSFPHRTFLTEVFFLSLNYGQRRASVPAVSVSARSKAKSNEKRKSGCVWVCVCVREREREREGERERGRGRWKKERERERERENIVKLAHADPNHVKIMRKHNFLILHRKHLFSYIGHNLAINLDIQVLFKPTKT
jgi:hypothetical protein